MNYISLSQFSKNKNTCSTAQDNYKAILNYFEIEFD